MKIRLASTDDIPALYEMVVQATEDFAEHGTPRQTDVHFSLIVHGIRTGEAVVVAEQDGGLVGWLAWCALPASPAGQVEGLGTWVHPDYRRDHVARDMREFAAEHCRMRGHKFVIGVAMNGNDAGLQSVLKMGFRVVGQQVRMDFDQPAIAATGGSR